MVTQAVLRAIPQMAMTNRIGLQTTAAYGRGAEPQPMRGLHGKLRARQDFHRQVDNVHEEEDVDQNFVKEGVLEVDIIVTEGILAYTDGVNRNVVEEGIVIVKNTIVEEGVLDVCEQADEQVLEEESG